MVYRPKGSSEDIKEVNRFGSLVIGVFLGFFSGLIGIGGGIILSPIIVLLRWGTIKETAAVSAAFILVNSISGLIGQFSQGIKLAPEIGYMLGAAVLGGIIGAYIGSYKVSDKVLKYTLAVVLTFASIKLQFL